MNTIVRAYSAQVVRDLISEIAADSTEEEVAALTAAAAALAVVERLAAIGDPSERYGTGEWTCCFFCKEDWYGTQQPHTSDCLWSQARALVTGEK